MKNINTRQTTDFPGSLDSKIGLGISSLSHFKAWTPGARSIHEFDFLFGESPRLNSFRNDEQKAKAINELMNCTKEFGLLSGPNDARILELGKFWELTNFVFGEFNQTRTPDKLFELIFRYLAVTFFEDDKMEHDLLYSLAVSKSIKQWESGESSYEDLESVTAKFYVKHVFLEMTSVANPEFVGHLVNEHLIYLGGIQNLQNTPLDFDEYMNHRLKDIGVYPWWACLEMIADCSINVPRSFLTLLAHGCILQNDALSIERDFIQKEPNLAFHILAMYPDFTVDDVLDFVKDNLMAKNIAEINMIVKSSHEPRPILDGLTNFLDGITKWYEVTPSRYQSCTSPFIEFMT